MVEYADDPVLMKAGEEVIRNCLSAETEEDLCEAYEDIKELDELAETTKSNHPEEHHIQELGDEIQKLCRAKIEKLEREAIENRSPI